MKRIATALVLLPLTVWLILSGPQWAFTAAMAAVALAAFYEFDQIAGATGALRSGLIGMAVGVALLLSPMPAPGPTLAALAVVFLAMIWALRTPDLSRALITAAAFALGVFYIFGAIRCAVELRAIERHWLMFTLIVTWAGDTAAMYTGRTIGRHKMAPRVSPGKTWEGAAGSVVGGVIAGAIYAHFLLPAVQIGIVLAIAIAANVAGQIGDLCESALKRGAGVKDSGSSLPGHGGWLDRIDASLFSIPTVYALVLLLALHS